MRDDQRARRWRFRVRTLAVAVALIATSCGGNDGQMPATTTTATAPASAAMSTSTSSALTTTTASPRVIEVSYARGRVVGGMRRASAALGERVRIRVTSDVADTVHVHTYDIQAEVTPTAPAEVDLVASIPGRHEVELERKHQQLLELEVR